MNFRSIALASVVVAGFVSGCTTYYKVTEPGDSKVYYTDKVDRKDSGAIVFKDAASLQEVTLPASSVQQITKDQFEAGRAQAAAMPAMPPTTRP